MKSHKDVRKLEAILSKLLTDHGLDIEQDHHGVENPEEHWGRQDDDVF